MYLYYLSNLVANPVTKACVAIICTILLNIIGMNWVAYEVLLILVMMDTLLGTMIAYQEKNISSQGFFRTGKKLIVYFTLLISAHQVVRISDLTAWLDPSMALFCAATELISIIENAHRLGIPVPKGIVTKLEQYRRM